MPDILSQGGGRELGPWPRRVAVVTALVLVAVAIVYYLPHSRHGATPQSKPTVTASPLPPAVSGAVSGDGVVADEPDGITGQVSPWPSGLRLLAAGHRPAWFWPATGQTEPIEGLPQRSGYQFDRAPGGWTVQGRSAEAGCGCAGPPRSVYFLADAGRSVTPLGQAAAVAPGTPGSAGRAGTVWLTSYPPDAAPAAAAGTAQEVSVAGQRLGRPVRLPAGYLIVQGTSAGLLLAPVGQLGSAADKLWDPGTRRYAGAFGGVIAASATRIAWVAPCTGRCRVQVLDLATGRQVTAELPKTSSVASASFSPDGALLALQVSFGDNDDDGQLAVQLQVVSTASGRLTVVPQTWASSDALVGFGWPASGDNLVAELNFTTKTQLASWRPGAGQLAIAVLTSARSPAALVFGQYSPLP
ncbi:MAG TPA: hypothetical protein VGG16_22935 [Streptosporangiaceae bacterium]